MFKNDSKQTACGEYSQERLKSAWDDLVKYAMERLSFSKEDAEKTADIAISAMTENGE